MVLAFVSTSFKNEVDFCAVSINRHQLADLAIFIAVAEACSFTEAARELQTSTAAISRSISRLERHFKARLINRTTRRMGLTELGADLFERSRVHVLGAGNAMLEVAKNRHEPVGLLRVTCAHTFGKHIVAPAVVDFSILYPNIEIELTLSDDIADLVSSGHDIAIRGGLPHDDRLVARPLASLPMYVCASPELLRRYPVPQQPEDLKKLPCVRFQFRSTGEELEWEFSREDHRFKLAVTGPLRFDDLDAVCEAALAGVAYVQLPGYLALPHLRAGRLVQVLADSVDASRKFHLTYVNRTGLQPLKDKLFIEHMLTCCADRNQFEL